MSAVPLIHPPDSVCFFSTRSPSASVKPAAHAEAAAQPLPRAGSGRAGRGALSRLGSALPHPCLHYVNPSDSGQGPHLLTCPLWR